MEEVRISILSRRLSAADQNSAERASIQNQLADEIKV